MASTNGMGAHYHALVIMQNGTVHRVATKQTAEQCATYLALRFTPPLWNEARVRRDLIKIGTVEIEDDKSLIVESCNDVCCHI